MGCDIHVVVQRRDGDRWSVVDPAAELEINGKWLGQHSFSWVSAAELVGYDWSKPSRHSPGETLFDDTGVGRWLPWLLSFADPAEVRVVFGFDK